MIELADLRRALLERLPDVRRALGVFGAEPIEIREHVSAARQSHRAEELVVRNQLDVRAELAGPAIQVRQHREPMFVVEDEAQHPSVAYTPYSRLASVASSRPFSSSERVSGAR
jgi:hypothetical protein